MKLNRFTKSLIVLVGFLSLLSIYSYIRIIRPYLDVGEIIKVVPKTPYFRQEISIDGEQYSYWTNGVKNPKKILVLLPPSSATGDFFAKYAEILPKNVLIISPDYPGRGLTSRIKEFDTAPRIASRVAILLKKLIGKKEFVVAGPSFGGMIATNLVTDKDLHISKIFLIATGEFFAPDQRYLFHVVFYPASISEKVRLYYLSLLKKAHTFENLDGNTNTEDLLEQWLTVLGYKIDTSLTSSIPASLIILDNDNVVQKESYGKLESVFPNYKVYHLSIPHKSSSFFDPELIEVISSNI